MRQILWLILYDRYSDWWECVSIRVRGLHLVFFVLLDNVRCSAFNGCRVIAAHECSVGKELNVAEVQQISNFHRSRSFWARNALKYHEIAKRWSADGPIWTFSSLLHESAATWSPATCFALLRDGQKLQGVCAPSTSTGTPLWGSRSRGAEDQIFLVCCPKTWTVDITLVISCHLCLLRKTEHYDQNCEVAFPQTLIWSNQAWHCACTEQQNLMPNLCPLPEEHGTIQWQLFSTNTEN